MQSIYRIMSWACHRRCPHCYDARFRPYVRNDLSAVIGEGQAAWPAIMAKMSIPAASRPERRSAI